ncbi:hypothetical protein Tco_0585779 [Tanacetum coccineum]
MITEYGGGIVREMLYRGYMIIAYGGLRAQYNDNAMYSALAGRHGSVGIRHDQRLKMLLVQSQNPLDTRVPC